MAKHTGINKLSQRWNILFNMLLGGYSFICLASIILVFMISISDSNSISYYGYSYFPKKISFAAYRVLLTDTSTILRVYLNSILVILVGPALHLLLVSLLAYPLSRNTLKYRNKISFILYFTTLFNGGMVPWYIICTQVLGLRNTFWALVVPYLVAPFNVIIMRTFFKSTISDSLIESAKLDGASELRVLLSIVYPLSLPVMATLGLFISIQYWNDWWLPTMLIDDNRWINLQYAMTKVIRSATYLANLGLSSAGASSTTLELARMPTESVRMAMCIFAMGPIVLAYPFLQRYFIRGLTIGAVKG